MDSYISDCDLTKALRDRAASRNQIRKNSYVRQKCLPLAAAVKLLLLDVDGVLTDGSIIYSGQDNEVKSFHVRDGFGLSLLRKAGVEIGLITARKSKLVQIRAEELGNKHVYQGRRDKMEVFRIIAEDLDLTPDQVAYMGDDWLDLPLLTLVGLSSAPADSVFEVLERVDYVSVFPGGKGAVREVCELILEARGDYDSLLNHYLPSSDSDR
ncbi:MAG: KdsC family phosphatase [Desulfurivibrionaceae bacterium]